MGQRRLDQRRTQSVTRNQRPASAPSGGERLADDRGRKPRRSLRRIDIERREQQRFDQPAIQYSIAGDDLADRFARRRPQKLRQRQIVERARARHAPVGIEHPERQPAVVEAQRPAFAAGEIDEREFRGRRTDQPIRGADAAQIVQRGAIAREQKVIAVVDRHADRRVVIGTAAAAGERRGLVHDEAPTARGKLERGRQAGEAGTDNVHRCSHWQNGITGDCAAR